MPLLQKTTLDQVAVAANGVLQLRFGLLIMDGDRQIDCKWHRTAIEPGGDIDAQIGFVNQHLVSMGRPEFSDEEKLQQIKAIAETAWTPEVVSAYRDSQKALESSAA